MRLTCVRFTIAKLMVVVLVLSLNFAWIPWPLCAIIAVAILPPMLVEGLTLIGWCSVYSIAGILVGLLMPPVVTHCGKIGTPPTGAGPAPGISSADPLSPEVPKY